MRNTEFLEWSADVCLDFGRLASDALFGPYPYLSLQTFPHELPEVSYELPEVSYTEVEASSSRSKALYFLSGGRSFLLKKARGTLTPSTNCSSEASVVSEVGASWREGVNSVASAKTFLVT
jgi:hypothetical protein